MIFWANIFDRRVFVDLSVAVAKAAMETGVARITLDIDEYRQKLINELKEKEGVDYFAE